MTEKNKNKLRTMDMALSAVFATIIAVCSWISIPSAVPFTMQTFGVFLTICTLGGKRSIISVLIYIFIGIVGIPVFSGFTAGIGSFMGSTGGFIIGFLAAAVVAWIMEKCFGKGRRVLFISVVLGLMICYISGTVWFMTVYSKGTIGMWPAIAVCVLPYVIPDIIKLIFAFVVSKRLVNACDLQIR